MGKEAEIRRLFWHVLEKGNIEAVAAAAYLGELDRILEGQEADNDVLDLAAERLEAQGRLTAGEWIEQQNRYRGR
ncbi:hypothetical protein HWB91_gp58 [Bacillus phage vB_BboS-125]|uniref:Uncharacterized protein n=1 Tax=Bacillus phage vB_BboS-125 TaxID=2419618 RepID=A0A3G3BVZ0_9CAUD|nr:hypothetical protein HWB91_gp58 [Bacillus phage vB_BboS-125]AYP68428.1 hypothetical protein BboS125_00059 [Bacillus phage vB_BboS-125]